MSPKSPRLSGNEVEGITIDPPFARDLDDAISVKKTDSGYVVNVFIADVALTVPINSEMDRRARDQGFTHYFPRHNVPMLPREFSEDSLSLLANQPRSVIAVSVEVDDQFNIGEPSISKATLLSKAKLSYEYVELALKHPQHEFHAELTLCHEVAQGLLNKRRQRGALVIYDVFNRWSTTEEGLLKKLLPYEAHLGNIIVQELMILANEVVARFMVERGLPTLFRNHTAKIACPERSSLLDDLFQAANNPQHFPIETLQERIALVMNRATYSPLLHGHYGLNLPAYIHFTSPIRRYSDLVNHRTLDAVLTGKDLPYDQPELERLGQELTEKSWLLKNARSEAFKIIKEGQRTELAERSDLSRLPGADFHRVIRAVRDQKELKPEVADEILHRLSTDRLEGRDLYCLLLEASEASTEAWARIKKQALDLVTVRPELAITILNMGVQQKICSEFKITTAPKTGPDHQPSFATAASVLFQGKRYESPGVKERTKKGAEQRAAAILLQQMVLPTGENFEVKLAGIDSPPIKPRTSAEPTSTNHKGRLLELCIQKGWGSPTFSINEHGADHERSFSASASIVVNGVTYTSTPSSEQRKKDAEQQASRRLLEEIESVFSINLTTGKRSASISDTNFVSSLGELCVARRIAPPDYQFDSVGPSHIPTLTCCGQVTVGQTTIKHEAKARNKKDAKQMVARLIYLELVRE